MLGIVVITFLLVHVAPGDPALDFAGEGADQGQIDAAREYLGLDRPVTSQFAGYARKVVTGDLGMSFVHRRPVVSLIADRLGPTLLLSATALIVSTTAGLGLAIWAGRRPGSRTDSGSNLVALVVYSLPAFWVGQLVVMVLAVRLRWLPTGGMNDARDGATGFAAVVDTAEHLLLPALVLALSEVALLLRVCRAGLKAESRKDYLRTAEAKGLAPSDAVVRHALPNVLLPVVTVIGSRVGFLVSGAVLVESVFNWPGLGRLMVEAGQSGDHPVILGMVLFVSAIVLMANLATDLVYSAVDPRIRLR